MLYSSYGTVTAFVKNEYRTNGKSTIRIVNTEVLYVEESAKIIDNVDLFIIYGSCFSNGNDVRLLDQGCGQYIVAVYKNGEMKCFRNWWHFF